MKLSVSTHPYEAADWLADRHPRVRDVVTYVSPNAFDDDLPDTAPHWLDELAQAVIDYDRYVTEREAYRKRTTEPRDEDAWERWEAAGPQPTAGANRIAIMSDGIRRLARLLATLSVNERVAWSVSDVGYDDEGSAVMADWLQIVFARSPYAAWPESPVR